MNTDESNYSESTMYTHTLVFCKDNKTTGDFFVLKRRLTKELTALVRHCTKSGKVPRTA